MSLRSHCVLALLCTFSISGSGSEIVGKIILEKNVNRKTVAPTVYDLRGIAVPEEAAVRQDTNQFNRVAVWLESKVSAAAPVTATMQQLNRHFDPDLLIVPVGSTVNFPNLDPIFHNIFSLSRTQSFDLGYYSEKRSRNVKFLRPGIVQVYCHVHPSMYAVIVVTDSAWSCKPAEDGTFSWKEVPPGKYKLNVWQKSIGVAHRSVTVPETGAVHVKISLPEEDPEN